MLLPSISNLESLVPELIRLSHCHKSDSKQIDNFSMLMLTAGRLWIIERSLYCSESDFFVEIESEWFDCITWLRQIEAKIPNFRDRSLEYFILGQYSTIDRDRWLTQCLNRYKITEDTLNKILASRLFGVVNKTLRNNFKRLTVIENPRLEKSQFNRGKYKKTFNAAKYREILSSSPNVEQLSVEADELTDFFHEGVSSIAQLLLTKFHGTKRLFIQAEYVAKEHLQDKAADWADRLKEVWKQKEVSPIEITYHSASLNSTSDYIVYPVAIHYFQRAFYLYAWGETPRRDKSKSFNWYGYRLERILQLNVITWENSAQTRFLKNKVYQKNQANYSFTPRYIREQLDLAYGFNFYYKANLMLLRFNRDYHQKYIKDTIRHSTFEQIGNLEEVKQIILQHLEEKTSRELLSRSFDLTYNTASIRKNTIAPHHDFITHHDRKKLLEIIDCYPNSAYYRLNYRVGDNNVIMRLRSWGFNVEVILPWNLRQKMKEDLMTTYQLYL